MGKLCSPTEHDDCGYSVRGKDLPEKEGEFEDNISNVEYGQQPLISISYQVKVVCHSSYDSIANVATVEKGEHV